MLASGGRLVLFGGKRIFKLNKRQFSSVPLVAQTVPNSIVVEKRNIVSEYLEDYVDDDVVEDKPYDLVDRRGEFFYTYSPVSKGLDSFIPSPLCIEQSGKQLDEDEEDPLYF